MVPWGPQCSGSGSRAEPASRESRGDGATSPDQAAGRAPGGARRRPGQVHGHAGCWEPPPRPRTPPPGADGPPGRRQTPATARKGAEAKTDPGSHALGARLLHPSASAEGTPSLRALVPLGAFRSLSGTPPAAPTFSLRPASGDRSKATSSSRPFLTWGGRPSVPPTAALTGRACPAAARGGGRDRPCHWHVPSPGTKQARTTRSVNVC